MTNKQHYKLVILGSSCVGKSSIVLRFYRNTFFENSGPTIGAAFYTMPIPFDNRSIILDTWDTAGQERFRSIAPVYYRNSHAVMIVFDITDNASYDDAKNWVAQIKIHLPNTFIFLVANKCDLKNHRVSIDDAIHYAKSQNILFSEASAKSNINIDQIFTTIAKHIAPPNDNSSTQNRECKHINLACNEARNSQCKC